MKTFVLSGGASKGAFTADCLLFAVYFFSFGIGVLTFELNIGCVISRKILSFVAGWRFEGIKNDKRN